jgi:integrase
LGLVRLRPGRRPERSGRPIGSAARLRAALDVHPRVAMRILRHANSRVTMEVYTEISSEQTRAALKKLGDSLQ